MPHQTVSREDVLTACREHWDDARRGEMNPNTTDLVGAQGGQRRDWPEARARGLLSVAAAPTFAIMALLTGIQDGSMPVMLCSSAHASSSLTGMVPMYLLMSAFHSAPWLKLIANWRSGVCQA